MKSFILILLFTIYSPQAKGQAPSKEYFIFKKCNYGESVCVPFPALLTVASNYIDIKNNEAELRLWIEACTKDSSKQYYMLALDSIAMEDQSVHKIYRGACVVYYQHFTSDGKPMPAKIFVEVVYYTNPMTVYRANYYYLNTK